MNKTKLGQAIIKGLEEAVEHEQGKRKLKTQELEIPDPAPNWKRADLIKIRKNIFNVSQPVFADILCVSPSTVRAWEQGVKKPSGTARRLIQILSHKPEVLIGLARKGK